MPTSPVSIGAPSGTSPVHEARPEPPSSAHAEWARTTAPWGKLAPSAGERRSTVGAVVSGARTKATPSGPTAAGTLAGDLGASAPEASTSNCAIAASPNAAAYRLTPSAESASPNGLAALGTVAGSLGDRPPPAPTSYCEIVLEPKLAA